MPRERVEPEFRPIDPNPYIVGNPVRDPAMFFGRKSVFELVRTRVCETSYGGLIVLCGERRSGKTSILFQILAGRLGPDFIPVLIDMQAMVIDNEAALFARISREIQTALAASPERTAGLEAPAFSGSGKASQAFYDFMGGLVRVFPGKRFVLLFDEYELFESKIETGVLTRDVLDVLAGMMERYSVFLVFTGSQHLEQRRRDYWQILPKSVYRRISYLEREEALRLIREPVAGSVVYAPGTVEAVLRLTGGHPFYTQAACQVLVDLLNERATNRADPSTVAAVADELARNPPPQMVFLWSELEPDQRLALSLVAETLKDAGDFAAVGRVLRRARAARYPVATREPELAGAFESLVARELLLRGPEGGYSFRMDLWRTWVRRTHSVWQVLPEAGITPKRIGLDLPGRLRRSRTAMALAAVVLIVVAWWTYASLRPAAQAEVAPTWRALAPEGSLPPSRDKHIAVYDPLWNRMLVFGGEHGETGRAQWVSLNDVWALSLAHTPVWSRLGPAGVGPGGRHALAGVHDPMRDMLLVFAGFDGTLRHRDLWSLSLDRVPKWTELHPSGGAPPARTSPVSVLDALRDRVLVFGGFCRGDTLLLSDVWAFSYGEQHWERLAPRGDGPGGRADGAGIYDAARDRLVIFGGIAETGEYQNDVYALRLSDCTWTRLLPAGRSPAGRKDHSVVYDPHRQRMIAFGGYGEHGRLNDLWSLSLNDAPTWTELRPRGPDRPSCRNDHSAVYDPLGDRMIVFGGSDDNHNRLSDAWQLEVGR